MGTGSFIKVVAKNIDVLAGPFVTLVYPLYASVKAIETKSPIDDQQWLTYWILYSLITLFELTFAMLIEWLPFWPYAKLMFNCCEPDDVLSAVERFIEENGPDAFEKLLKKAKRVSNGKTSKKSDLVEEEKLEKAGKKKHVAFNLEETERTSKQENYQSSVILTDGEPNFWSNSGFIYFDEGYRY
ncbi:hypothetical protein HPP92_016249 [Vanilla planifolia]|nr:hypothetical protein HPP92_016249 [Vanilla planifolia]